MDVIVGLTDKNRWWGESFYQLCLLSTENLQENQEIPEVHEHSPDEEFERMVSTFTIPENIDPILLEVWLRREKKAFLAKQQTAGVPRQVPPLNLPLTYAAYLSIVVTIVVILLGLLGGIESDLILKKAFPVMLLFFGIGYLIGWIINNSIHESVREMVREVIRRSEKNGTEGELHS